jgi:hypothetical protein
MTQENQASTEIPVEREAPAEIAAPTAPPKPSSPALRGFVGGLLGGVTVAALLAGGLVATWPKLHETLLAGDTARQAALERSLDEVNQRLAALDGRAASHETASLAQRLAALEAETRTPSNDPRVAALAQKTDQTAEDLARLTTALDAVRRAIPPEGTILRLAERAEQAEKAVRDVAAQQQSAQALLLVVGQLREAIDRGDPYDIELRAARRIAPADEAPSLDALTASAPTGVTRRDALVTAFLPLASTIVRAEFAPDGDFWQRALNKLTSLVNIRRIDGDGADTAAIVARAESRVKDGDLAKAVQELSALQGAPAQTAAPWVKAAGARVAADRALSQLAATAAAQTATKGG